jgi:hypothetical protein
MPKLSPWARRWARLRSMSKEELLDRARQNLQARIDAYRCHKGYDFAQDSIGASPTPPGRFFFEELQVAEICRLLRGRMPATVAQIVASAEKTCQHRFDLLGFAGLDYGPEINWHLDMVHGKQAPRLPWFKIGYLDFAQVGDAKITWELNRHQHLVTLAKAYRLTGNQEFADEAIRQWQHWQHENPYPIGVNWTSSLEVAFRSLSWIWTFFLLQSSPVITPELQRTWERALALNARHIDTYLSTFFSPNTHLLGEAVALFFIGMLFPGLKPASRWKERGWKVVLDAARDQIRDDGFYFEQSAYYHVYALDFFLHARVLAARNGVPIPSEFDAALVRMLETLLLLGRAGIVPQFGDDDGGRVFDPRRNQAGDLLDPLTTGTVLFQRGDFKFLGGSLREETLWLLGPSGLAAFEEIPTAEPSSESVGLRASGLYLMADAESGQQLLIDAGPHGPGRAGHGHADALALTLASNGQMLLADPGTLEYVGPTSADRAAYRGTAAHNTLRVDGLDQAENMGPFAWAALPTVKAERWVNSPSFNLFEGSHDGYQRLADPVTHRRWVFHRKSKFWFVRDLAVGAGKHALELNWHLGPTLAPVSARDYVFRNDQESFALVTTDGHGWSQSAHRGYWSPAYGRQERAMVLSFSKVANLPAEFVTLLLSHAGVQAGIGRLEWMAGGRGACGYRYATPEEEHCFFFSVRENTWALGPWTSDASFLYWWMNRRLGQRMLISCGGSYADCSGARVFSGGGPLDHAELFSDSGRTELTSPSDGVQLGTSLDALELESAFSGSDVKRIGV